MSSGKGEDILRERIGVLERAMRNIIDTDCCGCSVYGRIARMALCGSEDEPEGPPEPVAVVKRGAAGIIAAAELVDVASLREQIGRAVVEGLSEGTKSMRDG